MQQCKGQPATAVSKMAGEKWKALSTAEKKPFEDEYALKKKAYQEAMAAYKKKAYQEPMAAYKKSGGGGQAGDAGEDKEEEDSGTGKENKVWVQRRADVATSAGGIVEEAAAAAQAAVTL